MIRIIALTELAAFYACYFGKMLAQRRQGIQPTSWAAARPDGRSMRSWA